MSTKRLVMIVEDEASIRNLISTLLISNDYAVVTAENGHSALTLIASHNPDLILLDLGLPDMDGIEVLKTIRTWSAAPVIVVSARGFWQTRGVCGWKRHASDTDRVQDSGAVVQRRWPCADL